MIIPYSINFNSVEIPRAGIWKEGEKSFETLEGRIYLGTDQQNRQLPWQYFLPLYMHILARFLCKYPIFYLFFLLYTSCVLFFITTRFTNPFIETNQLVITENTESPEGNNIALKFSLKKTVKEKRHFHIEIIDFRVFTGQNNPNLRRLHLGLYAARLGQV